MHSSSLNREQIDENNEDALVAIATLVIEGRIPGPSECPSAKSQDFHTGPHCQFFKKIDEQKHQCCSNKSLCQTFNRNKEVILKLFKKGVPIYIEVLLTCPCKEIHNNKSDSLESCVVLEQWHLLVNTSRDSSTSRFNVLQLANAIRSQLYFSQITAWLVTQNKENRPITSGNLRYRLSSPDDALAPPKFFLTASKHEFPTTDLGNGNTLSVTFSSCPRSSRVPAIDCLKCKAPKMEIKSQLMVDDRMRVSCTLKGKHCCEDNEDNDNPKATNSCSNKRLCQMVRCCHNDQNDLTPVPSKGQLLLDAIERSGQNECDNSKCDTSESDNMLFSNKQRKNRIRVYEEKYCDRGARRRITFDDDDDVGEKADDRATSNACDIPTASEQAKFRKNLGAATTMVFHSRTGLPLTSSPAPVRRGKSRFDFDSSLNSVSAIRSALFSNSFSTDDESESDGSIVSPCSPDIYAVPRRVSGPVSYKRRGHHSGLLGSFEESVLNGRLEPSSTVHGFTAELGASGSFVPKHIFVPVTIFFYSFDDNESSPYLGHINLGKKGYNVPKSGTVQVTLFNPMGTVVKMFVIMYDLSDMPPNSQTFIRQRTLYMPINCSEDSLKYGSKWLRFLIHLRFMSSKSGKIYLHSDIRMIISRKSDMDTATAHNLDTNYELRSFTHGPTNPKYSPRK